MRNGSWLAGPRFAAERNASEGASIASANPPGVRIVIARRAVVIVRRAVRVRLVVRRNIASAARGMTRDVMITRIRTGAVIVLGHGGVCKCQRDHHSKSFQHASSRVLVFR